jgi:hypothetical protein
MPILSIQPSQTGLIGVLPSIAYIETTDTIADVVVNGYLNTAVQSGLAIFSLPCMCCISTIASAGAQPVSGWYTLSFSAGNWNLAATSSTGGSASGKDATNNALPFLASTAGSGFAIGDLIAAGDTAGTLVNSGVNLQTANIAISAAEFQALYALPYPLIGAPGAGNLIVVHSMVIYMNFVSIPYANASGTNVFAQYNPSSAGAGFQATSQEEASDFFNTSNTVYFFTGVNGGETDSGAIATNVVNQGVYLAVGGGPFITGDSTFNVQVLYSIISV